MSGLLIARCKRPGVELKAEALLITSGDQSRARRAAHRRGDVGVGEERAALPIESMFGVGISLQPYKPSVAIAEIVAEDEHDVRLARRLIASARALVHISTRLVCWRSDGRAERYEQRYACRFSLSVCFHSFSLPARPACVLAAV